MVWTPWGIHWTSVFSNIWYHTSFLPSNLYPLYVDVCTSGEGKGSRLLSSLTQVYESTPWIYEPTPCGPIKRQGSRNVTSYLLMRRPWKTDLLGDARKIVLPN